MRIQCILKQLQFGYYICLIVSLIKQNIVIKITNNKRTKTFICKSQQQFPLRIKRFMNSAFDFYQLLRSQQVHYNKIINPEVSVPRHQAFKPIKAKIQEAKLNQRIKKQASIERQNMHIMKKLFTINKRKPALSSGKSTSSFSLPPIVLKKKPFLIPQHENQNNIIAYKLINSKSSINVRSQLKQFHEKQKLKQKFSKYLSLGSYNGSEIIDRKRHIAQLMMLKKVKLSQQTESRVKKYISGTGNLSLSNNNVDKQHHTIK